MKSLGKVLGPEGSFEVSRRSLGISKIAMKSLGRIDLKSLGGSIALKYLERVWGPVGQLYSLEEGSGYQQDSCEVSRTKLGSSRVAVKSLGRVRIPAGWLCNL